MPSSDGRHSRRARQRLGWSLAWVSFWMWVDVDTQSDTYQTHPAVIRSLHWLLWGRDVKILFTCISVHFYSHLSKICGTWTRGQTSSTRLSPLEMVSSVKLECEFYSSSVETQNQEYQDPEQLNPRGGCLIVKVPRLDWSWGRRGRRWGGVGAWDAGKYLYSHRRKEGWSSCLRRRDFCH